MGVPQRKIAHLPRGHQAQVGDLVEPQPVDADQVGDHGGRGDVTPGQDVYCLEGSLVQLSIALLGQGSKTTAHVDHVSGVPS
jgi:hypothetical protein